ncbi:molybdopterin-dependent oxidoreductase, partial [Candidatus Poribacteria bacterium]|nr:molybdopterin-dependent oxidoreductase [Candidatus Poribacteria bacterium]
NIYSGNVIDLCPVGCLTSKPFRFKARSWELRQTQTTCDHCSSGCKVTAWMRNNKLYRVTPPSRKRLDHFTINEDTEEFICNQGRFASDYGFHESRIDESLVRRAGRLTTAPFKEAIRLAGERLSAVIKEHGPASVAVLVSPRATIEEGFLAARLAKDVIGTQSVDWRCEYATAETAHAVSLALSAADGSLEQTPDVILAVNGNLSAQSPILAQRLQEAARRFGARIIILGHQHDAYLAAHSKDRFHNMPGRTADVLSALTSVIAGGGEDELAAMLGASAEEIASAAAALRGAKRGLLVQGLEDFAGRYAPDEVPAAIELRRVLGPNWGYLPVVRARNAVGLHAIGAEPGAGGVSAAHLARAIEDKTIRALFVLGADALAALPEQSRVRAALGKLAEFIVCDPFRGEIAEQAGIALPLATNIERDGIYADIEGNIARLKEAAPPPGDSRPGWEILTSLGRALGAEDFGGVSAGEVWCQARAALAPASGASHEDLELEGSSNEALFVRIQELGGARNRSPHFNPGSYRKDGLHLRGNPANVTLHSRHRQDHAVTTAEDESLTLTWGTHVSARGYLNDRASIADILLPKPFVEVNPRDAVTLGVAEGQFAILHIRGGRAKVAVKVTRGPAPGCVYLAAGTYGPFDASENPGPITVTMQPLTESVPDQGEVLVAAGGNGESH